MSKIENKGQIDYWSDLIKKTIDESQDIKPFLGYSQVVGFTDLRLLEGGFTIIIIVGDKKLSWKNYGSHKYCVNVTRVESNCDSVYIHAKRMGGFAYHSYDFWNFSEAKYYLINLVVTYYKFSENYSTELVNGLKLAISLIANVENILKDRISYEIRNK